LVLSCHKFTPSDSHDSNCAMTLCTSIKIFCLCTHSGAALTQCLRFARTATGLPQCRPPPFHRCIKSPGQWASRQLTRPDDAHLCARGWILAPGLEGEQCQEGIICEGPCSLKYGCGVSVCLLRTSNTLFLNAQCNGLSPVIESIGRPHEKGKA